jgi:hypothetical protein
MGMFGDIFGGIGQIMGGQERKRNAKYAREDAIANEHRYYRDKNAHGAAVNKLDFQPAYASDGMGDYKRSESPAARAYLESLLTGDNTQAAASPWSTPAENAATEDSFGKRYGSIEGLLNQGDQEREATPWAVKSPGKVDRSAVNKRSTTWNEY